MHGNYIPILRETRTIEEGQAYELLREVAVLLRARGVWKADNSEVKLVISDLARKLDGYNLGDVRVALKAHEAESSFFPSYAELMKHIQPRIDYRIRHFARRDRNIKQVAEQQDFKQDPPEVRKQAVAGWRKIRAQWLED